MSQDTAERQPPGLAFRYGFIFLLAMTEIMPVMLLGQTMPVLLRRGGASMAEVGVFYLVMAPWALKFLWAPMIDRFGSDARGRYRSWLLWVHPLLILSMLGLSLVDFPAMLFTHRGLALALLAGLTVISATADTAADGLAIGLLTPEIRGVGNGFQMAGTMMGNLVSGGLLLVSMQLIGWQLSCKLLALLLLVPFGFVLWYREPPRPARLPLSVAEVLAPLRRPEMRRWLILVACIEASYATATTPMQAMLSDRGLALEEIGLILGILGSVAGALGGLVGGFTLTRYGRRRAFFGLALLTGAGVASMSLATAKDAPRWLLYSTLEAAIFGIMALGTVVYTMMMDRARGHAASSDYTAQYCALQLSSFSATAMGGVIAGAFGARFVFGMTPVVMLVVFGVAAKLLTKRDFSATPLAEPVS